MENIEELALELGCNIGRLPTIYLELPMGMRRHSTSVWDGVEERFRRKLAIRKKQYISKGGRLTLIRSTLSNLPVYLLSLFRLPKGVNSRLKKIQRNFLRGGGGGGGNLDGKILVIIYQLGHCLLKQSERRVGNP